MREPGQPSGFFYGWVIVGASCVLMSVSYGSGLTLAVFLKPLTSEFGWSRGVTSLAYSFNMLLAGCFAPLMGYLRTASVFARSLSLGQAWSAWG